MAAGRCSGSRWRRAGCVSSSTSGLWSPPWSALNASRPNTHQHTHTHWNTAQHYLQLSTWGFCVVFHFLFPYFTWLSYCFLEGSCCLFICLLPLIHGVFCYMQGLFRVPKTMGWTKIHTVIYVGPHDHSGALILLWDAQHPWAPMSIKPFYMFAYICDFYVCEASFPMMDPDLHIVLLFP